MKEMKKMEISLEAVPRSEEALREAAAVAARFPAVTLVNVPDLTRFSIRSWEACALLAGGASSSFALMPHLRARDFHPSKPFPLGEWFARHGIDRVLVISGDPPEAGSLIQEEKTSIELIKKLKRELPDLQIYAAFDPYRTNIRYELDYLLAKEDAGAAGFFSQPFFDLRLLEIYAEYLEGKNVFWGVSPVLSAGSRNYWESRNRAVFPRGFQPDLAWNVAFGRQVYRFCQDWGFNLYLMPIKTDVEAYLAGIFAGFFPPHPAPDGSTTAAETPR